jgi:hypothetical protein
MYQSGIFNGHNEVKEWFQASLIPWGIILHLKNKEHFIT